jgi:hypothetical protein
MTKTGLCQYNRGGGRREIRSLGNQRLMTSKAKSDRFKGGPAIPSTKCARLAPRFSMN